MKRYVVDASVILATLLESRKETLEIIDKYMLLFKKGKIEFISTPFLKTEVANGLRFNTFDSTKAIELFDGFAELPINYLKLSSSLYEESIFASFKFGTTVYDTLYHMLALDQHAVFLTCDEKYYRKAKGLGSIELIK